jgi:hypothetical protein
MAVGLSVCVGCSVYEPSLLGSGLPLGGVSGDSSLNASGTGGAGETSDGGAVAAGGIPSEDGFSGGMSDAGNPVGGNSVGGAGQEVGGMPGGGRDAAGATSGGGNAGGLNGAAGSGGNANSAGNAGSGGAGAPHELGMGKSVTVSSQQSENPGSQGNDGDTSTRWAAAGGSFPQWWRVDLGASHQLVQVSILFEHSDRTYYYTIETSTDDAVYAQQITANGTGVTQTLTMPANVVARYVRVTVTNGTPTAVNGIGTWASFWECALLGY